MYATLDDMLGRFEERDLLQLTDAQDAADPRLASRVAIALADAADVIDAHVAAKYQTATVPIPSLLTKIACDLARHQLYGIAPPDSVVEARKSALAMLKDIARGTIRLDGGEEEIAERPGAILVERPPRLFGRKAMEGY